MNEFENYDDRLIYLGKSFRKYRECHREYMSNWKKKWLLKQLETELSVMSSRLKAEINHLEKE